MADEPSKTPKPAAQPDAPEQPTTPASADAPKPEGKTYTEAEVNAMVADRISKNEKSLRKKLDEEQAEAKRQAALSAEERAKELEAKLAEAEKASEARVQAAERRAALAGKVSNPERVLKLMDDPEAYFDGTTPNVEAILRDFPEYAATQERVTAPSAAGAPAAAGKLTLEQQIAAAESAGEWDRAFRLKNQLARERRT
jgi:hypothetical protein